jgi:hypothetical protein
MFRMHTDLKARAAIVALIVLLSSMARAEDVYIVRPVGDLTIADGKLPQGAQDRAGQQPVVGHVPPLRPAMQPYAALDGAGEVYLDDAGGNEAWVTPLDDLFRDDVVAIRIPEARDVTGRLFAPKGDASGMVGVAFKAAATPAREDAKARFDRAKARHYERLLARDIPGAAWFRHRVREAGAKNAGQSFPINRPPVTQLEQTYDLFSGGRAVSENLQLDRPLQEGQFARPVAVGPQPRANRREGPRAGAEPPPTVKVADLKGITVAEIDWAARIAGKDPALDPLAGNIPADQHALFLPDLKAAAALLAEAQSEGYPVLWMGQPHAEDGRIQARYERQLGVSLADLGRVAGSIRGLAVTGSDPYLPTGTDLAILFDTEDPQPLLRVLRERLDAARESGPQAKPVQGAAEGVEYAGARSPDRRVSSYVAAVGKVVVLTNSLPQLERIVAASKGEAPALAALPEYRFFRDRYRRGEADESALLILSDATIRRWCGPRWRIASSRRVRAAAFLAELQAEHLKAVVADAARPGELKAPQGAPDLGDLSLSRSGVTSSIYNTLDFLTPIAEIPLEEAGADEGRAYDNWRNTYQANWRGTFDPIALRVSLRPRRLAADLTVMPLIASSQYRPFVELVGGAEIADRAGDPHPEALLHAIMALDVRSQLLRSGGDTLTNLIHSTQGVVLGWLGKSAALYIDDDPFWNELAAAKDAEAFLSKEYPRIPLALHFEVTDGVKLALFLSAVRAFVEQSAPDLVSWETRKHGDHAYVRIAQREGNAPGGPSRPLQVFYAATPRALVVSLSEDVVKRHLDRTGKDAKGFEAPPWPGKSLALRASRRGFEVLGGAGRGSYREALQLRAWGNLPILNEWKRLFPDQDPVRVHEAAWGVRLLCPGGGRYVWNEEWRTMESTAFGHPGQPRPGPDAPWPLARVRAADFGLSFQDQGLRARAAVELRDEP